MDPQKEEEEDNLGAFSINTAKGHRIDAYSIHSVWYYILHIFLIVYGLGYIASLALIQNAQVEHTYTKANVYGTLHSDRYVSAHWLALFLMSFRPLVFVVVCSLLLYRNTTCCGKKAAAAGCNALWVILLVLFVLADLLSFAIMSGFYTKCNGIGQVGNPCNSYKWCCAPEIYSDPGNLCADTVACIPPVTLGELRPQVDFIWLYSVSAAFAAFDVFFLMLPVGLWLVGPTRSMDDADADGAIDAEDDLLMDVNNNNNNQAVLSLIQTPMAVAAAATARRRRNKKQA